MTGPEVLDVSRDAIMTLIVVSSPVMLVGLAVGVAISLLQALTQIQEMTIAFVPKILAIFLSLMIALPFMAEKLHAEMLRIAARWSAVRLDAGRHFIFAGACGRVSARFCARRHDGDAAARRRRADDAVAGSARHRAGAYRDHIAGASEGLHGQSERDRARPGASFSRRLSSALYWG